MPEGSYAVECRVCKRATHPTPRAQPSVTGAWRHGQLLAVGRAVRPTAALAALATLAALAALHCAPLALHGRGRGAEGGGGRPGGGALRATPSRLGARRRWRPLEATA